MGNSNRPNLVSRSRMHRKWDNAIAMTYQHYSDVRGDRQLNQNQI